MLRMAIYGMGRWGNRLVESIQASDKIRITKVLSRDPGKPRALRPTFNAACSFA